MFLCDLWRRVTNEEFDQQPQKLSETKTKCKIDFRFGLYAILTSSLETESVSRFSSLLLVIRILVFAFVRAHPCEVPVSGHNTRMCTVLRLQQSH